MVMMLLRILWDVIIVAPDHMIWEGCHNMGNLWFKTYLNTDVMIFDKNIDIQHIPLFHDLTVNNGKWFILRFDDGEVHIFSQSSQVNATEAQ